MFCVIMLIVMYRVSRKNALSECCWSHSTQAHKWKNNISKYIKYNSLVVIVAPQDPQIVGLSPGSKLKHRRVLAARCFFFVPVVEVTGTLTSSPLDVEYTSWRERDSSQLASRRSSSLKLRVPTSPWQVTSKWTSSSFQVLGSSVGQMLQSKSSRLTTDGWHSPQPQHFSRRSRKGDVRMDKKFEKYLVDPHQQVD